MLFRSANRPCELRIFPYGKHGMLLGLDTLDIVDWVKSADNFLNNQWQVRENESLVMEKYTNEYQVKAEIRYMGE